MPNRTLTTVLYLALASAWIFFSDRLLLARVFDAETLSDWQSVKGLAFVGLNAALIFWLIGRGNSGDDKSDDPLPPPRLKRTVAAVFVFGLGFGAVLIAQLESDRVAQRRGIALDRATDHAHALGVQIERGFAATYALAAVVRQGQGRIDDFPGLAAEMLPLYGGITALGLAPDGVVAQIHPLAGNESVIGVDILKDPARRATALAARQSRRLTLAGPLPLKGGGIGLIGRMAVFVGDGGNERFWGFATAVMRLDALFRAAALDQMREAGYDFELVRLETAGEEASALAGARPGTLADPVIRRIPVANGTWELRVAPTGGWHGIPALLVEALLAALASGMLAALTSILLRQPLRLQRQVEERTRELSESEERFRAISRAAYDAIILIDGRGGISYWNPEAERMFGYTATEAVGRDLHELITPSGQRDSARAGMAGFRASGGGAIVGKIRELEAIRRGGETFPVELSVAALRLHGDWHAIGIVRDIGERKRAAQTITDALHLNRKIIAHSPIGILTYKASGPCVSANEAAARCVGTTTNELLAQDFRRIESWRDSGLYELALAALASDRAIAQEIRHHSTFGKDAWYAAVFARFQVSGEPHLLLQIEDISERKSFEAQLAHQANHDDLTGLPNRNLLADRIDQALAQAVRNAAPIAVLAIGLDRFARVNDSFGSTAGDQVLREVASRLRAIVRDVDTVARVGGDEFVVVLTEIEVNYLAQILLRRMQDKVSRPFVIHGQELTISVSIGVSLGPQDGGDWQILLRNATAAMRTMKAQGRTGFRFFTTGMNDLAHQRLALETELLHGIENREFVLHYQPFVDLRSGRIVGAEALVRWQHPKRGLVPPLDFIPIAEETGLILPLSDWILNEACRQNQEWTAAELPAGRISVNLSARQFADTDLVDLTRRALAASGLAPAQLEFELTESMAMQDIEQATRVLNELKTIGVRAALDDFGIGHSSLSYLQRFSVTAIKIDRTFVHDIAAQPNNAIIVSAIIAMAHHLGLRVVGAGVETVSELNTLRRQRCDEIQGYHFSRPLPAAEYEALLRASRSLADTGETGETGESQRTLLLVDDEPNVLAALKRLMRRDGYRVLTANNAREGLELLAAHRVQVILSDQRMPEMSGTEFLFRVKQIHPDTVRIVLSGYTELSTVTEAVNQGAIFKFLTKPWDDETLRETIRQAFRMKEDGVSRGRS